MGDILNFTVLPKDSTHAIIISKGLNSWALKESYFETNEVGVYTMNILLNHGIDSKRMIKHFEVIEFVLNNTFRNETIS